MASVTSEDTSYSHFSGMVGEGAKGRAGGGGDAGLHVRDLPRAGCHEMGRGDVPEGGQGVLQVLAEHPEEVHGKEVGWVQASRRWGGNNK